MHASGKTIGVVGGLAAAPRRVAARDVAARGGVLRHGITRQTDIVVFGRRLLARGSAESIAHHYREATARKKAVWGEREFLRWLTHTETSTPLTLDAATLSAQSELAPEDIALLSLFAAFEGDGAQFAFTDVILARKYAGLIATGADWFSIARALPTASPSGLTPYALRPGPSGAIHAERDALVSDLDGQTILPLDDDAEDADDLFDAAEAAEADGDLATAIALYRRCLAIDATDSVAAFNLGNCLRDNAQDEAARQHYMLTIKRDPTFVEAWFNLAALLRASDDIPGARKHLERARKIDPEYADAIYNLAALEFDAGNLDAARSAWMRYLELDPHTEWAQTAARGIRYIDMQNTREAAGQ